MMHETARNVASILEIPASHISDDDRAVLLLAAVSGVDCYAYGHERLASGGILNLWYVDTRIALAPVEKVWEIVALDATRDPSFYHMLIRRGDAKHYIQLPVDFSHYGKWPHHDVPSFAHRKVRADLNHCGVFDIDPMEFANTRMDITGKERA